MKRTLEKATQFFDIPVDLRSRAILLLASLMVIPAMVAPLWQVTFQSSRYPDGLTLNIYSYKLEGGTESDLLEINALNYYMGIRSLEEEKFLEFRWLPFVLGATIILALRVIVLGKMSKLVDLFFLVTYSGLFALWSFHNTLSAYGHSINPSASVTISAFTPPLFGTVTVGHVQVHAMPVLGAYSIVCVPLLLVLAIVLSRTTWVKDNQPTRDYIR